MIYGLLKQEDQMLCAPLIEFFCDETNASADEEQAIFDRIKEGKEIIVAAKSGHIYGVLGFYMLGNKALADFFYVIPQMRGHMIGGKLHREACKVAAKAGAKKLVMLVDDSRVDMYIKLGYQHKYHVLEKEVANDSGILERH